MKKLLLVLCGCSIMPIAIGQSISYDTIPYAQAYHQERVALFSSAPIVKRKIIFLGNSITEFGNWQQILDDSTIINRGIAGDNTFGVLARIEDILKREPEKLFIEIGINDISQNIPPEVILKNISTITKTIKAKSPETTIYIHSILPTNDNVKNKYPNAYNKNDIVKLVNRQIKKQAKINEIVYIDIYNEFSDKEGKLDAKFADTDGIHLNNLAYKIWVELLKKNKYL